MFKKWNFTCDMEPLKGVRCIEGRLYLGVSAGEKSQQQKGS